MNRSKMLMFGVTMWMLLLLQMAPAHSVPITSSPSTDTTLPFSTTSSASPSNETAPSIPITSSSTETTLPFSTSSSASASNETGPSIPIISSTSNETTPPFSSSSSASASNETAPSIPTTSSTSTETPPPSPISTERNCSKEVVDNLVRSANETCSQISIVDGYILNVNSRQPIPVPSFNDRHGFKDIFSQYNGDLNTAQINSHSWRNDTNVVGSLKDMVVAAQGFEPKFKQEFEENQNRTINLLENHEDIAATEAKISTLQQEIIDAEEALKLTNVSVVVTHLENVIKMKEEEINSTMKYHEVAQARREVAELVKYLEFVKTGAAEVEAKAENARAKISSFRDNIVRDAEAFKRHRSNAQKGISKLQQEQQNNNNEINSNKQSIHDLTANINEENRQIASLNGQIANARRELSEIEARLNRHIKKTRRKKKWGRVFRVTVPYYGNKYYKKQKADEEALKNQKINFINEHTRQVQNLQAHIARRNQDIASHRSRIASLEAKSRELEQELQHFSQLDGKLQGVESEVNVILPSIANAVSAVSKMKESFDTIKQNLGDAIDRATEAKTETELKNIKYFIYNEIEVLKCKWEDASDKISAVENCSYETD